MDFLTILFIGIGLAMDATAVSLAKGMVISKNNLIKYALILAITFGVFQGLMPLLGYYLGSNFAAAISSIDHWIAFLLLGLIGLNMIRESREEKDEDNCSSLSVKQVFILGIATSIDALAIGVSFAFLNVNIYYASFIIAITTFILSFIGVLAGKTLGQVFQKYAEVLGGSILIILGIKILIEHLFF